MYWSPATFAGTHSYACGYAVQPALRIALRLFGQDGVFPQLQLAWKMRQQGAQRVGAPKVRCNVRWRSLLRLRLRCPFFLANRRRLFGKKGNVRYALSSGFAYAWRPIPASLRAAEGPIREFPGFSRNGTHRVQPAFRIAGGSSGRMAFFPSFSWLGKCDSRCGKPPTLMLQQATSCLLSVLPCGSPLALRFSA